MQLDLHFVLVVNQCAFEVLFLYFFIFGAKLFHGGDSMRVEL